MDFLWSPPRALSYDPRPNPEPNWGPKFGALSQMGCCWMLLGWLGSTKSRFLMDIFFFFALKEVGFFGVISSNLQWLVDYNLMKKTGTWRIGTQWRVSVVKSARWFFVRPQAFVHNPFHSWPKFMANKGGPELPSPTTGPTSEPRKNPTNTFHFIGCFMGFFIMVYYTPHING